MALGDQLHCDLEMCPGSRRPAAHHGSQCRRCRQHAACIPPSLQRPHRRWHRLVLICETCAVIHLWCYGCGGRFMTQNKLLRSCMWWGNQEGKWAGNSLLHATLIHPSVGGREKKKKPCHYAHLIKKSALGSSSRAHSTLIPGPLPSQPRSPPQHLGLSEGFQTAQLTVLLHRSYVHSIK